MKIIHKYLFVLIILIFTYGLRSQTPYVIFVYIDGFRYDYLNRGLTPNLDKLSNSGIRGGSLIPVFPTLLLPNFYTLITGCYPEHHGILSNSFMNKTTGDVFSSSSNSTMTKAAWYNAQTIWETARNNGIFTASVMLPVVTSDNPYQNSDYKIDLSENVTAEFRIKEIIKFLRMNISKRPKLIGAYFGEVDETGHKFGPESAEVNQEIALTDKLIGEMCDSLKAMGLNDSTDIIFVSPYGMANIINFQTITLDKILKGTDLQILNYGPFSYIYGNDAEIARAKKLLTENEKFYHFFSSGEIPDSLHIGKHPFAPDLLILADNGWMLTEDNGLMSSGLKGIHGYDASVPDMKGIFIASGPSFAIGQKTGIVNLTDIYPLICSVLRMKYPDRIDGNISRINLILKH